ncbi:pseudouridine synthase [Desulfovibrio sp.]|uniref:pseudouridine synthase n=1 Tax=Desulfovibrio sp. TaxID=885 RepID=UPI0023D58F79|nr:pseudouridine synthase [Desulfovibrio sp.]MDE7241232.1 pseudouridine synthase [Desulfovibrio sp.]
MEVQFRSRNHDLGAIFPTFQERVNTMLPAENRAAACASSAAPALDVVEQAPVTPHYPTSDEVQMTLARVEEEAVLQSEELVQAHSGLNEQRVARLLGLLDD